jgi:aryl-alcohol dehydrogenase-like predicted oxidoreductase
MRYRMPRFAGEAAEQNEAVARTVQAVAARRGVTPAQIALAWVSGRSERLGVPVVPIPGTKRVKWIEENAAALDITLSEEDRAELDPLGDRVVGARY